MKRTMHVYEVTVIRFHCEFGEDFVQRRAFERFSIRAAGDISANKLASAITAGIRDQEPGWSVNSTEVCRVVNGKPGPTTRELYLQRRAQFGRRCA